MAVTMAWGFGGKRREERGRDGGGDKSVPAEGIDFFHFFWLCVEDVL